MEHERHAANEMCEWSAFAIEIESGGTKTRITIKLLIDFFSVLFFSQFLSLYLSFLVSYCSINGQVKKKPN